MSGVNVELKEQQGPTTKFLNAKMYIAPSPELATPLKRIKIGRFPYSNVESSL